MAPRWLRRASHVPVLDVSIGSPAFADMLLGAPNDSGRPVTERTALGSAAFYRYADLVSSAIAGLDLNTYRKDLTGQRVAATSIFDDPCGPWFTVYEWKQIIGVHLAVHGNVYLLHVYNGAGQLAALFPVHPNYVSTAWRIDTGTGLPYREYTLALPQTTPQVYTDADVTHIMRMSVDGLVGVSPLVALRNMIGTGLAGDQAAAKAFSNGLMMGGIVSAPDMTPEQAASALADLQAKTAGSSNAGKFALINKALTISPWQMTAEQGQFIESRAFQVEEVARATGVPKVFLAEDGASTWGSGIRELASYFGKFTLRSFTDPIEGRLSALLAKPRCVEFDFHTLYEGTPDEEDASLIALVQAGILAVDEARAVKQLPPKPPAAVESESQPGDATPPPGASPSPATTTENEAA